MIYRIQAACALALSALVLLCASPLAHAGAASLRRSSAGTSPAAARVAVVGAVEARATSLEAAASRAGETGRKVAMSLIGLAFAVAAIVLAFRRDFKEAAAVFAVGLVSVLLATPAGVSLLRDTVKAIVGS